MASRKGIEPLTPGLGNLCSILLSYRDQNALPLIEGGQSARPRSGEGHSMDFSAVHRFCEQLRRCPGACVSLGLIGAALGLASPAFADCGSPAGAVEVVAVDERLDIALADGRLVRLGGLDTPEPERGDPETARAARDFLSRLYLDLAPRDGPTIVVARKLETAFAKAGRPIDALAGQIIRARGVLDDRFGPRLEASEPAMIEVLRRSDAQGVDKPRL